jgi:hypothetical protein
VPGRHGRAGTPRKRGANRTRGQQIASELARIVKVTTYPSAILRMRDHVEREHAMGLFVDDLATVAAWRNQTS